MFSSSLSSIPRRRSISRAISFRISCRTKIERISQILQFPVVIERSRTFSFDPQLLQEFDFIGGGITAQRRVLEKFAEPRFFVGPVGFSLDILEFLGVHGSKPS